MARESIWRASAVFAVIALCAITVLACGSSSHRTGSTNAAVLVPRAQHARASVDAVAVVSGVPISKLSYEHWLAIEKALGAKGDPGHLALGFLITSQWVLEEAAARKLQVSRATIDLHLREIEKVSFTEAGQEQAFLSKSGETKDDLVTRVRIEMLQRLIVAQVATGRSAAQRSASLRRFEFAFQRHWRKRTSCLPGYVMEDCSQYRGTGEDLAASASAARALQNREANPSEQPATSRELPPPAAGTMTLTSPAFARNGQLPERFTCDGSNTSPPLTWQDVPRNAQALVLFVIDAKTRGRDGGIRWVVGDIKPTTTGVAAGQTPAGGIAGSNTGGTIGYGGICPPAGQTSTVELAIYALRRKIPLTPGFQPTTAEQEYGGTHKLLLGQAAVTYALYTRKSS